LLGGGGEGGGGGEVKEYTRGLLKRKERMTYVQYIRRLLCVYIWVRGLLKSKEVFVPGTLTCITRMFLVYIWVWGLLNGKEILVLATLTTQQQHIKL